MQREFAYIVPDQLPHAQLPVFQHVVDTYASEVNKSASVWLNFTDSELAWRPDPKSTAVGDIFRHELLSQRRFFGEFLGLPEPGAGDVLPQEATVTAHCTRFVDLARARLPRLAAGTQAWWLEVVPFFDVTRQRIWIFWRRVLHSAHHRTQLATYLRVLGRPVPPIYGPTAEVRWQGADQRTASRQPGAKPPCLPPRQAPGRPAPLPVLCLQALPALPPVRSSSSPHREPIPLLKA